jgi:DNA-binding NtrC family response regulator
MKLMLVDDEKDFFKIFTILSKKFRFNFVYAENLAEAKNKLNSEKNIDLIIIDYTLPDGNGLQLSSYVKSHYPEISTALSTGHSEMVENKSLKNFDFYIKKDEIVPFLEDYFANRK